MSVTPTRLREAERTIAMTSSDTSPAVHAIRSRVIERNIINADKTILFYRLMLDSEISEEYRTCFEEFLELTDADKLIRLTNNAATDEYFITSLLTCELLCNFTKMASVGYRKETNRIVLYAPTNKRCREIVKKILIMFRVLKTKIEKQSTETSIIVESENGEKNYLLCLKANFDNLRFVDRDYGSPVVICTETSKMSERLVERIDECCRTSNKRLLMLSGDS